jgi:hypothetical protein
MTKRPRSSQPATPRQRLRLTPGRTDSLRARGIAVEAATILDDPEIEPKDREGLLRTLARRAAEKAAKARDAKKSEGDTIH